jgi:CheY-like chemotaxis protein
MENILILAVEDDCKALELLSTNLLLLGYSVLVAKTDKEAIALLNKNSNIKLMISNVILRRGMRGWELAELATRINPNIKIMLTSAYSRGALAAAGQDSFQLNTIEQPYTIGQLEQEIKTILF